MSLSDDEDNLCPLCVEEMDLSDKYFKPCPCDYQICRFCWHHIKENMNKRCPACRRIYTDEAVQFKPVSPEELWKLKAEKKAKQRQKKEKDAVDRKHLANLRVVQKNLVYVVGLHPKVANEETLRSQDYFGQYGKIIKLVINRKQQAGQPIAPVAQASSNHLGVYVTFATKPDAAKAIAGVDGNVLDGRLLRATFGTTKYCQAYLRNQACMNSGCMYLHEPGEEADSFSKEEMAAGKHHGKELDYHRIQVSTKQTPQSQRNKQEPVLKGAFGREGNWGTVDHTEEQDEAGSALPATASWANKTVGGSNDPKPTPEVLSQKSAQSHGLEAVKNFKGSKSKNALPEVIEAKRETEARGRDEIEENKPGNEGDVQLPVQSASEKDEADADVSNETITEDIQTTTKKAGKQPINLGINVPQPYTAAPGDPFAFAFTSPITVPDIPSPSAAEALPIAPEFSPSADDVQHIPYHGSFDPFADPRSNSAKAKPFSQFNPSGGSNFGVFNIAPPPGVLRPQFSQSDHKSSFDPFNSNRPVISPTHPPGISPPPASPLKPAHPPGLYNPSNSSGPAHVAPSTTKPNGPRKSSRFGFAQGPRSNVSTATDSRSGVTGPISVAGPSAAEPETSTEVIQEGFRALFPAAKVSFGNKSVAGQPGRQGTSYDEAIWNSVPETESLFRPMLNASSGAQHPPLRLQQNMPPSFVPGPERNAYSSTSSHLQSALQSAQARTWNNASSAAPFSGHNNDWTTTHTPATTHPHFAPELPTSSAQDFLGAFLKAAQQASPDGNLNEDAYGSFAKIDNSHARQSHTQENARQIPFQDPAIMLIGRKSVDNSTDIPPPSGRHRLPIFQHVAQGERGRTGSREGSSTANTSNRSSPAASKSSSPQRTPTQQQTGPVKAKSPSALSAAKATTPVTTSESGSRSNVPSPAARSPQPASKNSRKREISKTFEQIRQEQKSDVANDSSSTTKNLPNPRVQSPKDDSSSKSPTPPSPPIIAANTTNTKSTAKTSANSRTSSTNSTKASKADTAANTVATTPTTTSKTAATKATKSSNKSNIATNESDNGGSKGNTIITNDTPDKTNNSKSNINITKSNTRTNRTNIEKDDRTTDKSNAHKISNTVQGAPSQQDDIATLERKVIEARQEAALLENQLNAVIKKNRTYINRMDK